MRLKSYFAGTVESAMCLARQEMGEEAMLVHSRRSMPETRHLGAYEVVFAASQDSAPEAAAVPTRPAKLEEAPAVPVSGLAGEMAEVRKQLARIAAQVSRSGRRTVRGSALSSSPALDDLDHALSAAGVEDDVAQEILRNLAGMPPGEIE